METSFNLNVDRICRVCLQETTNKKPLTCKNDGDNRTLREVLSFVSNLDILLANQVPTDICYNCEDVLRKADAFKRCCQEAEAIFQTILNDSQYPDKTLHVKIEFKNKLYESKPSEEHINLPVNNKIEELLKKNSITDTLEFEDEFNVNFDTSEDTALAIKQEAEEPIKPHINDFENHQSTTKCDITLKNELDFFETNTSDHLNTIDLKCTTCKIEFNSLDDCTKHKCKLKKTKIKQVLPIEKLTCDLCMRQFAAKKNLHRHLKRHKQKQSKYVCTICNREFLYQGFLDKHVLSQHSRDKCLSCNFCPKVFTTKEALSYHTKAHNGDKKHECKICGKVFVMISTLKDHFRTHTGEKPFLCSVCGKGFSQKNNLSQHMRRHMGLKPFKCESCDQSFVSKGELDSHTRKHTGAHPFICDFCKNGFTTASSLVKHKRTHTGERPYACDLCPMKFAALGTLKNHRRAHTGEKPYQCSLCDRAFVQRQDLVSHIRCHTGERPYVCVDCGQSFRKNSALKMHSKIHLDPMTKMQLSGSVQV